MATRILTFSQLRALIAGVENNAHSLWSEQPLSPVCDIEAAAPLVTVLNERLDLPHRRILVPDYKGPFRAASKQRQTLSHSPVQHRRRGASKKSEVSDRLFGFFS